MGNGKYSVNCKENVGVDFPGTNRVALIEIVVLILCCFNFGEV